MWKSFQALEQKHQLIFAVVIGSALILFWRGIWGLSDLIGALIFPQNQWAYFLALLVFGFIVLAGSGLLMKELVGWRSA